MFAWLISHQSVSITFLSEQNSHQPAVFFSLNKSAPATSQMNRALVANNLPLLTSHTIVGE
jgi:hypothetical protein